MTPALSGLQTMEPTAVPEPALLPLSHIRMRDGETAASVAELVPAGAWGPAKWPTIS